MSERLRRVESQLKEIIGEEVDTLSDPRVRGLVTITGVKVTPDLGRATVYYSMIQGAEDAGEGLQSAAGKIQSSINRQTHLKRTPKLFFEPDPVVERAEKIEAALKEIRQHGNEQDQ
jgi:ribosome-binding factor A